MKPILLGLLFTIIATTIPRGVASESSGAPSTNGSPDTFSSGAESAEPEFISEVIQIKYAKASEIADALNRPGNSAGSGSGPRRGSGTLIQPGAAGGTSDRVQRLINRAAASGNLQGGHDRIIPDERSNSILIFATRADLLKFKNLITKLDVVLPQILIETVIFEVQLPDSNPSGSQHPKRPAPEPANPFAGSGVMTDANVLWVTNFISSTATNTSGRQADGFNYLAGLGNDFNSLTTALANDSRVNIIQNPRPLTSHAMPASIFIGATVPYSTGSTGSGCGGPVYRSP